MYAYNTYQERRVLWEELSVVSDLIGTKVPWSVLGDFNVCLGPGETNKGTSWTRSMLDFRDFILNLGLVDLRSTGKFFTWCDSCKEDPCLKKLDRCLVNGEWLVNFTMLKALVLERGLSDHCPVAVSLGLTNVRMRKPFQFFLHLKDTPEFIEVVKKAWSENLRGDPWFVLTSKLRKVKEGLRHLNASKGNLHSLVEISRNELIAFQSSLPSLPSKQQFKLEEDLRVKFQNHLKDEELFLKQKSRINWMKCGDGNNKYFFNVCKGRWNSNKILALENPDGELCTTHGKISEIAVNYFQNLMGKAASVKDFPDDIALPQLTDSNKRLLDGVISEEEVFNTFRSMAKGKSPGLDGMPVEFYLAAWSVIGADVTKAILFFFSSGKLPRIINSTAIALVPKIQSASNMADFRPISCCNVLYKCITKLLAARLKLVLPSLISLNQSAFVPHRHIGDNIMLALALFRNYHLNSGQPRCAFKIDMRKAFDTLSWQFLFEALRRMNIPDTFINWVKQCSTTCMLSVKINGSIEGFFPAKSGLRQWVDCCYPKDEGGLGLKNIFVLNRAAILYQLLRFLKPNDASLWVKWVRVTVLNNKGFWTAKIPKYASWCLKKFLMLEMKPCVTFAMLLGLILAFISGMTPGLMVRCF